MLMHIETRDKVAKRTKAGQDKIITGQEKKQHITPRKAEEREVGHIRRILILEVLAKIIHLGHIPLVKRIEPLIKTLEAQYKGMNANNNTLNHPGMAALGKFCEEVKNGGAAVEDGNDDMMFPDQDPLDGIGDDEDDAFAPPPPTSGNSNKKQSKKVFSKKFVPDEKKLAAKRGSYSKPWLENNGGDADDE